MWRLARVRLAALIYEWRHQLFALGATLFMLGLPCADAGASGLVTAHQRAESAVRAHYAHPTALDSRSSRDVGEGVALAVLKQALDVANADRSAKQQTIDQQQQKIDDLTQQVAAFAAYRATGYGGGGVQLLMAGSGAHTGLGPFRSYPANTMAYGNCTYFVASWRSIPWHGNAIEWWANAAGYRPEGQAPEVGAIMVSRESWYGHVALVEAVYRDGTFLVSEMNWAGWAVIDFRVVSRVTVPVVGFIY